MCVHTCVQLSNMNISETSEPIVIKFYLKHHLDGGKAVTDLGADLFRTLAMDSSHRVIMGKKLHHVFSAVFDWKLFILAGYDDKLKSLHEFEIRPDPIIHYRVSCP